MNLKISLGFRQQNIKQTKRTNATKRALIARFNIDRPK
ncbi:hypothetical protein [Shewanella sp. OMA3-2]